jgi:hypothetical protein
LIDAAGLYDDLTKRGIRLVLDGETIRAVAPAGRITAADRELITANKLALLALLQQQTNEESPASNSNQRLPDPPQFPALFTTCPVCTGALTVEHFEGWEHSYCPIQFGHSDEWRPVETKRGKLSAAIAARQAWLKSQPRIAA